METARFTIQCLDGPDRGKVWRDLLLPVRIGRGVHCEVQLDEPKLLPLHWLVEDAGVPDVYRLVSCDGSEHVERYFVNGHFVYPEIRVGDLLTIGRSVLLVGSREQIRRRVEDLAGKPEADEELSLVGDPEVAAAIVALEAPPIPQGLDGEQHKKLAAVLRSVGSLIQLAGTGSRSTRCGQNVELREPARQLLLLLWWTNARYLRQLDDAIASAA